ncbi:hypothetical protein MSG28_015888 [Choristoneura fumiferana]|uniref:Uncharacterized protein n=1 Tax=Choristoneura fumiferana TaxID=7141 RepID=A0ACC0K560_CHOFU|nr:hypothetical protein MSG28_015888 [Choristoneura fumiferana]
MYDIKSESSTANTAICCGCLSTDRRLSPLVHYDLFYSLLGNKETLEGAVGQPPRAPDLKGRLQAPGAPFILSLIERSLKGGGDLKYFDVLLCWECTALLRRVAAFRTRLQNAQCVLKLAHDKQIQITSLSILESNHRQGYHYIIEETIEEKPDIELFVDNCTEAEIKQEIENDHFESDSGHDKLLEAKAPCVKNEKKHVKIEKDLLKIDNDIDFSKLELYFTKVHLSETEVQESLAKDRDDNDSVSRPLKCGACGFRFTYKSDLQSHKREYHNKRSLLIKCPVCGDKHSNKSDLMLHWRRSHPVNRCLKCARVVERDLDRRKHLHLHRFRYRCKQCDVDFPGYCNTPPLCSRDYPTKLTPAHNHPRFHHYNCKLLTKGYGLARNIDRLLYAHHERRLHSRYVCDYCGRSTVGKKAMERHITQAFPHRPPVASDGSGLHERSKKVPLMSPDVDSGPVQKEPAVQSVGYHGQEAVATGAHSGQRARSKAGSPNIFDALHQRGRRNSALNAYNHLASTCSCGRVFGTRARLLRHAAVAHPPDPPSGDKGAYCVECDLSFPTRGKYRRHLVTAVRHRPRKKESIPCPECGKIFSRKNYMKNHLKLFHTNDSKHYCMTCDKAVRPTYIALRARLLSCGFPAICAWRGGVTRIVAWRSVAILYVSTIIYSVGQCATYGTGRSDPTFPLSRMCSAPVHFVTGFALRTHNMYVHEKMPKPKTKICNVCGRLFGTNRVLANHMRTHTGERPFACARCSAAFAQQVALRAHLAAIHKEK